MAASRWPTVLLGDVAEELTVGHVGTMANEYVEDGVPFLRSQNIEPFRLNLSETKYISNEFHQKLRKSSLRPGDVVIVRTGKPGTAAIIPESVRHMNCSDLVIVRPGPCLDSRFLCYFINGVASHHVSAHLVGAVQQHFNVASARQLPLNLPSQREQRAIADVLGTLDDKIELNRRMNGTLEAMARALFKSWFVDFDPVRANREGRQPVGMDAETARLFPDAFEASEIGEVPRGWRVAALGDLVTALSGGTPAKGDPSLWNGTIPWISPKVMTGIHADRADAFVTNTAIGNGTRLVPCGATLVMVRGMGLHRGVRVSQARREVTINQDVKALVPLEIDSALLLFAVLDAQQVLLTRVESAGNGTGRLPTDVLMSHRLVMPPLEAQQRLGAVLECLNARIAASRSEAEKLASIRDALLPRLLSGEVRLHAGADFGLDEADTLRNGRGAL